MDIADSVIEAVGVFTPFDPTGISSVALVGTKLIMKIARATLDEDDPDAAKKGKKKAASPAPLDMRPLFGRFMSGPKADTEAQSRAYETVNFVVRQFGAKVIASEIFSPAALERALANANAGVEVSLFSEDANKLFRSLAKKSDDHLLVNSTFASIYLIGALTNEMTNSLPLYKPKYDKLGPKIVQQLFIASIGQDAYNSNTVENEKCFEVLASTAGILRPTDIGYTVFPGLPTWVPNRYSNPKDTGTNLKIYKDLIKQFEKYGFPQPVGRDDVGPIVDWRFLTGNTNSKEPQIEKSDKHIGEEFGKVLYWLVCSADRLNEGHAIIVYFEQHVSLVKWLATKFDFKVVSAETELDMTSKENAKMDKKHRAIFNTWVLIMPPLVRRPVPVVTASLPSPTTVSPPFSRVPTSAEPEKPTAIADAPASAPSPPASETTSPTSPTGRRKAPPLIKKQLAKAIGDFVPAGAEELAFSEGDVLVIVGECPATEEWWKAKKDGGDGTVGFVPSGYLALIESPAGATASIGQTLAAAEPAAPATPAAAPVVAAAAVVPDEPAAVPADAPTNSSADKPAPAKAKKHGFSFNTSDLLKNLDNLVSPLASPAALSLGQSIDKLVTTFGPKPAATAAATSSASATAPVAAPAAKKASAKPLVTSNAATPAATPAATSSAAPTDPTATPATPATASATATSTPAATTSSATASNGGQDPNARARDDDTSSEDNNSTAQDDESTNQDDDDRARDNDDSD